jgi:ferritin-like metal-binding protein YciE
MTDTARDAKHVQYLSEAYGKEKELETALQAHITMTTRKPYKKRLQDHLKETKGHARELERRIKKLSGGGPSLTAQIPSQAAQVVGRVKAAAEGPIDTLRGTGENEQMLKNAQKEYWNEHDEIAKYTAIETLAESVGDKETAQLARSIRRDEERMAKFAPAQERPCHHQEQLRRVDPQAGSVELVAQARVIQLVAQAHHVGLRAQAHDVRFVALA